MHIKALTQLLAEQALEDKKISLNECLSLCQSFNTEVVNFKENFYALLREFSGRHVERINELQQKLSTIIHHVDDKQIQEDLPAQLEKCNGLLQNLLNSYHSSPKARYEKFIIPLADLAWNIQYQLEKSILILDGKRPANVDKNANSNASINDVPNEVLTKIFLQTSSRSLLRFERVSKKWHYLIHAVPKLMLFRPNTLDIVKKNFLYQTPKNEDEAKKIFLDFKKCLEPCLAAPSFREHFIAAVKKDDFKTVEAMLASEANKELYKVLTRNTLIKLPISKNTHTDECSAVHIAALHGAAKTMCVLLAYGADPTEELDITGGEHIIVLPGQEHTAYKMSLGRALNFINSNKWFPDRSTECIYYLYLFEKDPHKERRAAHLQSALSIKKETVELYLGRLFNKNRSLSPMTPDAFASLKTNPALIELKEGSKRNQKRRGLVQ